MEIQYGKMILHGILAAISYLVVPLLLFYFLELYGIMTFTDAYRIAIIIFGVIGIIISILRHAFPGDTSANRLVRFGVTVYSGIFLFYIFGGFDPGTTLGTYSINIPNLLQVLLGLKVIAWLLLGSTIIRGLQYLVEAIELRKKKEYRVKVKREFKVSVIFKVLGIIVSLAILGYFGSIIYSGLNLKLNLHDTFGYDYDNGGTPLNFTDDSMSINISFDVRNGGLYAIHNVILNAEIHTETTDNNSTLPWNTQIGGSLVPYQNTFHSFTVSLNQTITINILDTDYIEGLITTNGFLKFIISFSTVYALIFIDLTISLPNIQWNHP
ncbi:MAG: hypothetical protein JSV62_13215 [Promethearchaeota archaeon]|nr:MAG: hypothetical protein JSV62_13215 [Candidatus Lokiarchaeota archaeon]